MQILLNYCLINLICAKFPKLFAKAFYQKGEIYSVSTVEFIEVHTRIMQNFVTMENS